MPLGNNVRYRFKRLSNGKAVRLAFKHNKVVEATLYKKRGGVYRKHKTTYKRYIKAMNKHL